MALEEELQLDIGPALDVIRGDLTRALEELPSTFRAAFDDQLTAVVQDFAAAADLARGELDRVFGEPVDVAPVDVPVEVDASQLDAVPDEIDAAGGPVDVPVEVDDDQIKAAADEVDALDGQTATVTVEADTSALDDAQAQIEDLGAGATSTKGAVDALGGALVAGSAGANKLSGAIEGLGGSGAALTLGPIAAIGVFAKEAIYADEVTRSFNLRVGDLADTLNRVDVAGLNTSLSELAIQVGADDEGIRLALARFVQLGEGSGRTRVEIGKMGQELTALAAYLSVTNPALGTADQILDRLPTTLARGGPRLAQFGISLTANAIQTEALAENVGKAANELTVFDKSAAALKLTMDQLGPSIAGGIGTGSESAAVRLRSLKTELKETAEAAGGPLIQPVTDALVELQPILVDVTKLVGRAAGSFAGVLAPAIKVTTDVARPLASALDKIPKPLLDLGAGLFVATKAMALFEAATTFVSGKVTAAAAAIATTEGPLATLEAAQVKAAAAAAAHALAEEELQVATGEAVAFATADAQAEDRRAAAQAAATLTAEGLAVAEEEVAVASATAEAALSPLLLAVTAVVAAFTLGPTIVRKFSDEVKLSADSVTALGKATDAELVAVFDKLAAKGIGTEFFKSLAGASVESATRLRDSLAAQGRDVSKFTKILDDEAKHQKEVDKDKALSSQAVKDYTAALKSADPAQRLDAANALHSSLAYEGLSEDTKKLVDDTLTQAAATDSLKIATDANAAALKAEADQAAAVTKGFQEAASALREMIGSTFDTLTTQLDFAITLDKTDAKIKDTIATHGKQAVSIDQTTVAGREGAKALLDLAKAQADVAASIIATPNAEPLSVTQERYKGQIDGLYKVYAQAGITRTAFDGLLKQVGLLPDQIAVDVHETGVDEARVAADKYKSSLDKLPPEVRVKVTAQDVDFLNTMDDVAATIAAIPGVDIGTAAELAGNALSGLQAAAKTPVKVTLPVQTSIDAGKEHAGLQAAITATGPLTIQTTLVPPSTHYQTIPNAQGAVYEAYATGGIRDLERYAQGEDHTAQIATTPRLFAEPETGGEAYIPLAPAKRSRSTEILGTVAQKFGYELVPVGASRYADGLGVDTSASAAWSDARMVTAIEKVVTAIEGLPDRIPKGGDTFTFPLTGSQQDAVREIAERVVAASRRR